MTTKTLDIINGFVTRRGYGMEIKNFTVYLFGFTMAVIGYYYQNEPETIKSSYLSVFTKLLGSI